jgi:hypothetical protein
MRDKAMAAAKQDAAGTGLDFFRWLNWLAPGAMLRWISSGSGSVQDSERATYKTG